jgi:DNA-binding transcriptional ArsR family regulator
MSAAPDIDRLLTALADPHRRRVVELLSQRPRAAGELARDIGSSAPAMSRHLRALREARVIFEARPELDATYDARVRIYALRADGMAHLKEWLERAERLWAEQLVAFKIHIEKGGEGR